ncbi:MAG TPA: hypothetical protein VIL65_11560 [Beijerinckiaceae bacterium]|jgi:hypothetical protein
MDPFWPSLAAKMATSAAIVVAASRVVERTGPLVGALVATLPVSAGPAYLFLGLEHGADFVAASALTSLATNVGVAAFILVYALVGRRLAPAPALGLAVGGWLATVLLATRLELGFGAALALNALAYGAAMLLTRDLRTASAPPRARGRWWDVPMRALLVMGLVALVVWSGRRLGPGAAGIAALMPVTLTSLALVLHPRLGGPAVAAVMAHSLPGMMGFTLAVASLVLTPRHLGLAGALLAALTLCLAWNVVLFGLARRAAPRSMAS